MIVTAEHLRIARQRHGGYCTSGVAVWFERHGLDLREFLRHGYPIETIEATNDLLGRQVAQIARESEAPNGR